MARLSRNGMDPATRVLAAIRARRRFLVTTHARGDGDAVGSALATGLLLKALGKKSQIVHDGAITAEYRWFPGASSIGVGPRAIRAGFEALIVLDAANADRYEGLHPAIPKGVFTINIDHHRTNTRFGDINWVDAGAAATGELVWRLVRRAGVRVGRDLATSLYAALLTDTGRFSFSNTTPDTLRTAADLVARGARPAEVSKHIYRDRTPGDLHLLGACMERLRLSADGRVGWLWLTRAMACRCRARPRDSQEYVEIAKSVRGVEIAILFREIDEPGTIKISVRTEPGIDAAELCGVFGGGGHARAGGATIRGRARDAERRVLAAARAALSRKRP